MNDAYTYKKYICMITSHLRSNKNIDLIHFVDVFTEYRRRVRIFSSATKKIRNISKRFDILSIDLDKINAASKCNNSYKINTCLLFI